MDTLAPPQQESYGAFFLGRADRSANLLLSALGMHHDETAYHCVRVSTLAKRVSRVYRSVWIDEQIDAIVLGALLHDIGKLAVSVAILDKPAELDQEEWTKMRAHPQKGACLCAMIPELEAAIPVVRHHHERMDGTGYPDRLRGSEIPLGARIVAVCDAYDVMTHERPYQGAIEHKAAVKRLYAHADSQFDRAVVHALVALEEP